MSGHVLVISLDDHRPGPVHPEQHIFPEHPDERDYTIVCTDPQRCEGWTACPEPHEFDGISAACGPHSCDCPDGHPNCLGEGPGEGGNRPRPPWFDQEEFDFHDVTHTWRNGWGWTVPYRGCIVAGIDAEWPEQIEQTPIGAWEIDEEWVDESDCYLSFTTTPPTAVDLATVV